MNINRHAQYNKNGDNLDFSWLECYINSQFPIGGICPFMYGYFTNSSNGGFTSSYNTAALVNGLINPKGFYVCNGSSLNDPNSPIFNMAGRYLPNISDTRFLMGSVNMGVAGGNIASSVHQHLYSLSATAGNATITGNHTHTARVYSSTGGSHSHYFRMGDDESGTSPPANATLSYYSSYPVPYSIATSGHTGLTFSLTSQTISINLNHSHSASALGGTIGSASAGYNNLPKFLTCFYIMRVK